MNRSYYDPNRDLANVEPGAAWKDVYHNLLNGQLRRVSPRRRKLILQCRNGFGCDTIVRFESRAREWKYRRGANADENPASVEGPERWLFSILGLLHASTYQAIPAVDLTCGTAHHCL